MFCCGSRALALRSGRRGRRSGGNFGCHHGRAQRRFGCAVRQQRIPPAKGLRRICFGRVAGRCCGNCCADMRGPLRFCAMLQSLLERASSQWAVQPRPKFGQPGLSIPRAVLDLLLWECAQQAGVAAHDKCEVLAINGRGPFTVATAQGEYQADAVILCTGRWSRFSGSSLVASGPKWIGLKAHYRERHPAPSTDLYFFDYGYCGVQPVGPDSVNVCALVRSDSATTLEAVFNRSPQLSVRAEQWERITAPVSTAPVLHRKPICVRDNILLAGDAAGFIDPFAGDGISLAMRSGQAAAQCLRPFLAREASLDIACQEYEAVYRQQFAPLIAASTRVRRLDFFARDRPTAGDANVANSRGAAVRDQKNARGMSGLMPFL